MRMPEIGDWVEVIKLRHGSTTAIACDTEARLKANIVLGKEIIKVTRGGSKFPISVALKGPVFEDFPVWNIMHNMYKLIGKSPSDIAGPGRLNLIL